jgi:hypothetical protein
MEVILQPLARLLLGDFRSQTWGTQLHEMIIISNENNSGSNNFSHSLPNRMDYDRDLTSRETILINSLYYEGSFFAL